MTGLGKQAKTLTEVQVRTLIRYVESETRFPKRNVVIVQLSFRAGLRAREIAGVTWSMLTDAEGVLTDTLALQNTASKGKKGGRNIPLHPELKTALGELMEDERERGRVTPDGFVVTLAKGNLDLPSRAASISFLFNKDWFKELGFVGSSSHSGRRTFITKVARMVSSVVGSMRDVQALAGHSSLVMTQRYVDQEAEAQRKLVEKM